MSQKIGEVIEASTSGFAAECDELHRPPPFGSLVRTREGDIDIYAVVSHATTASIEPGRRPIARGRGDIEESDIYRANPQLEKLLRTEFEALVIGHRDGGRFNHYLPPRPARIHSFVYLCDSDDVAAFNDSFDYLSTLVSGNESSDDLVAAVLRNVASAHDSPRDFLVRAGKELATLLINDIARLNSILRKVRA
ncbi:MAG: hypothetical protein U9N44_07695 [Chloroflexota bacterium]|nr:hypothetical protein [Chloroflexota bacterium]